MGLGEHNSSPYPADQVVDTHVTLCALDIGLAQKVFCIPTQIISLNVPTGIMLEHLHERINQYHECMLGILPKVSGPSLSGTELVKSI